MSKYIELAKKIKALADAGIEGEKINAELVLKRLMRKYKLTLSDIEEPIKKQFAFMDYVRYPSFSIQIVSTVVGSTFKGHRHRKKLVVECTASEAIEIANKLKFFYALLLKEEKVFYRSFIKANGLYPKNGIVGNWDDLSGEEIAEQMRIEKLAKHIEVGQYYKRLN